MTQTQNDTVSMNRW